MAAREYIPLRGVNWRVVLSIYGLLFVCLFFYKYLDYVANGFTISPAKPFLEEATGTFVGLLLFPVLYLLAIRFPIEAELWRRNLPIHLLAVCALSVLDTTLMGAMRSPLFPLLGLGPYHYGNMLARYPMEFANFFLLYWAGVSLVYLFHEIRHRRERDVRQAKLETSLAEAQLHNLQLQLEPHFLFNTLNAISAVVYEDPGVADEMIGRLSELLRQLFKSDRSQEVALFRELETLRLYTQIMQARFEHRLQIRTTVDPRLEEALVPQFMLQPLVENAIRHGVNHQTNAMEVDITVRLDGTSVQIAVADTGPGFDSTVTFPDGVGLRNTRERLHRLYGEGQSFSIRNRRERSGAIAEIRIPLQFAPKAATPVYAGRAIPA